MKTNTGRAREAKRRRLCIVAMLVMAAAVLQGCTALTSPDEAIDGRTPLGIGVQGGSNALYSAIDTEWNEVNLCWGIALDPKDITVIIMQPDLTDSTGNGVFKYSGSYYYGMRSGNTVRVCPDLAALRHEFSHIAGQAATGHAMANDSGQCWL